jgi:hypothetical protein
MSELARQIKVSDKTYDWLTNQGKKSETYDDIIWRLIEHYQKSAVIKK